MKIFNRHINQRDFSRDNGDTLAYKLIEYLKNLKSPTKEIYDIIADYAEKEKHSVLLMKLGLVEPSIKSSEGEKYLNDYKDINKPEEYENILGKRILKKIKI